MFKPQTAFACFMLLLALLSQGCGRKGPLYMPQTEPRAAQSQVSNPVIQSQPQATTQP